MKHVYVLEKESDSVTYIESNDVNILLFDRRDFANIQDLATSQGIYILYNDETVYVGQSSHTDGVSHDYDAITHLNCGGLDA